MIKKLLLSLMLLCPSALLAQGPIGIFSTAYGSTVTTLSTTSGTVLTANTTLVQTLVCVNTTASAATVTVTDTAGNATVSALSIAAHDVKVIWDSLTGIVMIGVKWWQGTGSALNCYLGGRQ